MVHKFPDVLDKAIAEALGWRVAEIDWRSPRQDDDYAEYYDEAFLDRLGVGELSMPLDEFWPKSGPRWDGLARTTDGKLILVEAKAHIDEVVDYRSKASPDALRRIEERLDEAKSAFRATKDACWHAPLYQMANCLAHLYYLAGINGKDAYLVFIDFANAPDVPEPASVERFLSQPGLYQYKELQARRAFFHPGQKFLAVNARLKTMIKMAKSPAPCVLVMPAALSMLPILNSEKILARKPNFSALTV
jgi:hypothetical protein